MTMQDWLKNATYDEKQELASKLYTWLHQYTQDCIDRVFDQIDDIINNEFAMQMINELYKRTTKEAKDEKTTMYYYLLNIEEGEENDGYDLHNHCLTHSNSYRDILWDMFIDKK